MRLQDVTQYTLLKDELRIKTWKQNREQTEGWSTNRPGNPALDIWEMNSPLTILLLRFREEEKNKKTKNILCHKKKIKIAFISIYYPIRLSFLVMLDWRGLHFISPGLPDTEGIKLALGEEWSYPGGNFHWHYCRRSPWSPKTSSFLKSENCNYYWRNGPFYLYSSFFSPSVVE